LSLTTTGIDKAKLFKEIAYKPHSEGQWDSHLTSHRFKVKACGRRWGKSLSAGHDMTYAMFVPDTIYWIIGPTYVLGEKEFRVVHSDFTKLGILGQCNVAYNLTAQRMHIKTPWNSQLLVKSAEKPKSLLGEGLDGAILSEAGELTVDIWQQFVRPALSDKQGWAQFVSTPKGFNWFYELFRQGQDPEFKDWISWKFPSWSNPVVFPGGREDPEIKEAEQTVSTMFFQQEYGAEFTTFEGKIYDEFDETIHITDIDYNPWWRNYWAFDFGFSNPFVCLDIMVDPSDRVYVWREYVFRYKSTFEHGRILRERENPEGFRVDAMFGDPSGADEIATLALILGPVWAERVAWKRGVEEVKRNLKLQPDGTPRLYVDRSCTNTIREFQTLRAKEASGYEKNPKEGQHDYDDHCMDALRYFHNHYFVLGAGQTLSDLAAMEARQLGTRGDRGFFQFDTPGFRMS